MRLGSRAGSSGPPAGGGMAGRGATEHQPTGLALVVGQQPDRDARIHAPLQGSLAAGSIGVPGLLGCGAPHHAPACLLGRHGLGTAAPGRARSLGQPRLPDIPGRGGGLISLHAVTIAGRTRREGHLPGVATWRDDRHCSHSGRAPGAAREARRRRVRDRRRRRLPADHGHLVPPGRRRRAHVATPVAAETAQRPQPPAGDPVPDRPGRPVPHGGDPR